MTSLAFYYKSVDLYTFRVNLLSFTGVRFRLLPFGKGEQKLIHKVSEVALMINTWCLECKSCQSEANNHEHLLCLTSCCEGNENVEMTSLIMTTCTFL
jgi:hypothetical protein